MKKFLLAVAAVAMSLTASAESLYITGAGEFTNGEWNATTPDEMTLVDGNYEIEVANLTQFKLSTACGSWDDFNGGVLGCTYGSEPGVAVELEAGNDANISTPWKGDYKVVVSGDLKTITLTTSTPAPAEEELPMIYFRGAMNGWGADVAWAWTAINKDIYKFVCADDQVIAAGEEFKIADADWNAINVGGAEEDIVLDVETAVVNGGNPSNLIIAAEFNGVAWINFNLNDGIVVVFSNDKDFVPAWEGLAGIETIAADNAAAVYYNLNGVRVANPANGLFIVKQGNKVSKVIL